MSEFSLPSNNSAAEVPRKIEPLHLSSKIDAAEISRLEEALRATFYERLLADRRRTMHRVRRFYKHRVTIIRWLAVVGLAVAGLLAWGGGLPYHGYRLEVLFALFFACAFVLSFFLRTIDGAYSEPWPPFWRIMAKIHSSGLLKNARKLVPFDAEYTFDGDSIMYFRTIAGNKKFVWQRQLRGPRVSGPGFTLLMRNEKSMRPTVIILHQPSAEMDAWLARMGCSAATSAEP